MNPPIIRIVAGIVFDAQGRMLVVRKRGTTAFMQPGGKFEPGETAPEALVRELNEELGFVLDPSSLESVGRFSAVAANEPGHEVDCDVFLLRVDTEGEVAAEIEELRWIDPLGIPSSDLPAELIAPLTRDVLLPIIRERALALRNTQAGEEPRW